MIQPLSPLKLHPKTSKRLFPWKSSAEIPLPDFRKSAGNPFQKRALDAIKLALEIEAKGYNIFLCGEENLDKLSFLLSCLEPAASGMDTAQDWVYVENFKDGDAPAVLNFPPGNGIKFRDLISQFMDNIGKELEEALASRENIRRREEFFMEYQQEREMILERMNSVARKRKYAVELDENGSLVLKRTGAINGLISQSGSDAQKLLNDLSQHAYELSRIEDAFRKKEIEIENGLLEEILNNLQEPFKKEFPKLCSSPAVEVWVDEFLDDIRLNLHKFLPARNLEGEESQQALNEFLKRYKVNVFVDNSSLKGAPIVVENNPTPGNLFGAIERESELGALVTDFTLVKSGSLHRANGGFLVIHVEDILKYPLAWEALMRALDSRFVKFEDNADIQETAFMTKTLRPEPIPLNVKVVLIGDDLLYDALLENEPRFSKLFKMKAHLSSRIERTSANILDYCRQLGVIADQARLRPFSADALAWLVDYGSVLAEDQERLSLKFPLLRDCMIEASALAKMENEPNVTASLLERSFMARQNRLNLLEDEFMEEYEREFIKVETSGSAIGQINGLSVVWNGDAEFGLPHRITCAVGVGSDGIIDLEREAELGGPIHSKAMMILKSYLVRMFAATKPLALTASLYFEQNYTEVEGDSASGAELAALLSALAETPARLDLAFTGAVSHTGEILPVGGVTRKIEGFYKLCSQRGFTGTQGVIIPERNTVHLMLSRRIIESVEKKEFFIYPVRAVEEALSLLTGLPPGKRLKSGGFSKGSLFDRVDRRLELLGSYGQNAFKRIRKN